MLSPVPLFSLERGGHEEVCVYGQLVVVSAGGRVEQRWGESGTYLPARSLLKPFQFLAGGHAHAGAVLEERAVAALGSISANADQLAALERWYAGDPLEAALVLPAALPLDARERAARLGTPGSQRCHPCFSKHMAILAACRARGWPLAGYADPEHPYALELRRLLARSLGRDPGGFQLVCDGCQLPTPVLQLEEIACLYAQLASSAAESAEGAVFQGMCSHPRWVGGPSRMDTELMRANPGRLIAKEGADGLLAIAFAPSASAPRSEGGALVVKLAAGHQPEWALLAAAPFLRARGYALPHVATPGQEVRWHTTADGVERGPLDVSPVLDRNIAVWPGDVGFERQLTSQIGATDEAAPAWQLLVSSIRTTLHVGAHADAPNHFTAHAVGIDRVPLEPYRGRCQVIELDKPRGSLITPEDLAPLVHPERALRAPRVLFKTGSFPDPERFNEDFVAFSADTLSWLEERGVLLVGLDTPSVDPFHSKTLPAHHATRSVTHGGRGLAILEGLELQHVPAGLYELVALPLRLRDADASPVRAVLWPLR
ncbi:MAG: Kynurenine formamidase [Pseudomonadota bacterium]|jgi:arylformamidase